MPRMRLLRESEYRDGATNMAIDCAIAEAVAARAQPTTLRLYGWRPFCLSLGYGQRQRDADRAALRARGWDIVRRPTGGKAILHGDELTYSLCLPLDHELASGDVVSSYRRLSAGLLSALARLGVAATAQAQPDIPRPADSGPVCFALPSHYEITVAGRKLIGSAQLRRRGVLLQHGSLPLAGDVGRICDVLAFADENSRELATGDVHRHATTLAEALERVPTWVEAASAMTAGFRAAFAIDFAPAQLSQDETQRAEALMRERFANPDYTFRR